VRPSAALDSFSPEERDDVRVVDHHLLVEGEHFQVEAQRRFENVEVAEVRIRFLHSVDFTAHLTIQRDALSLKRDSLGFSPEKKTSSN